MKNKAQLAPILIATLANNIEIVKLLVLKGANVAAVDLNNKNAMHYAIQRSHFKIVDYLLKFP